MGKAPDRPASNLVDGFVVELAKLRDYCLSDGHPRGRHKARIFRSRLGLRAEHAGLLRDALLHAARNRVADLRPADADEHGQRYTLDFEMVTASGRADIRSLWILRTGETVLRLTSCYVL